MMEKKKRSPMFMIEIGIFFYMGQKRQDSGRSNTDTANRITYGLHIFSVSLPAFQNLTLWKSKPNDYHAKIDINVDTLKH